MKSFLHRFSFAILLVVLAPLAAAAEDRPSILKLSHPERAGGRTLTLYGEGFGRRRQKVFLSETPLVIYRWSNRAIVVTLPLDLTAGEHSLSVVKGSLRSEPLSFRLLPRVNRLQADVSKLPVEVTITGSNFGNEGRIHIDGVNADITAWYPEVVTAQIPTGIAPAWHNVHMDVNGVSILAGQFGLPPRVASLSVTEGTIDTHFSFTGDYFGDAGPRRYVVFGDWSHPVSAPVLEWTAHKVTAKVPSGVAPGEQPVWLFIDNVPSERLALTVRPTVYAAGVKVQDDILFLGVKGANFGPAQNEGKVIMDGSVLPVIDWTQERIIVRIDPNMAAGLRELVVVANGVTSGPALFRVHNSRSDLHDGVWRGKYETPDFENVW